MKEPDLTTIVLLFIALALLLYRKYTKDQKHFKNKDYLRQWHSLEHYVLLLFACGFLLVYILTRVINEKILF